MSDNLDEIIELKRRITSLETLRSEHNERIEEIEKLNKTIIDENTENIAMLIKRIEELENKVGNRNEGDWKYNIDRISKLEAMRNQDESINKEYARLINKRIAELKSFLKELLAEIFIFTYPDDPAERGKIETQKYREFIEKLSGENKQDGSNNSSITSLPQSPLDSSSKLESSDSWAIGHFVGMGRFIGRVPNVEWSKEPEEPKEEKIYADFSKEKFIRAWKREFNKRDPFEVIVPDKFWEDILNDDSKPASQREREWKEEQRIQAKKDNEYLDQGDRYEFIKRISELEQKDKLTEEFCEEIRDELGRYIDLIAELMDNGDPEIIKHHAEQIAKLKTETEVNSEILKDDLIPKSREFLVMRAVLREFFEKHNYPYYAKKLSGETSVEWIEGTTGAKEVYNQKPIEFRTVCIDVIVLQNRIKFLKMEKNELIREFLIFLKTEFEYEYGEYRENFYSIPELVFEDKIKEYEAKLK